MALEKTLVDIEVLEAIYALEEAVAQCFHTMKKEGAKQEAVQDVWKMSIEVLGRLVLLTVDYDQLNFESSSEEDQYKKGKELELSVLTEAGEEIILSCHTRSAAILTVNQSKTRIYGKNRISSNLPESGWDEKDILQTIKKDLWLKLFKASGEKAPAIIDENKTIMLNELTEIKNRQKENIYICVSSDDQNNYLRNKQIFSILKQELPALHTIIKTKEETDYSNSVFIILEPKLEAHLFNFFKNKPE